jgi:hypothetical protein
MAKNPDGLVSHLIFKHKKSWEAKKIHTRDSNPFLRNYQIISLHDLTTDRSGR